MATFSRSKSVEYARVGGSHVAFQTFGNGSHDLLFACEWWNHLEEQWNNPAMARFLDRLGSFSRVIMFDKRGTGLSDPVSESEAFDLEHWIDDALAVLDAAGSDRAWILAQGGGSPMATVFAATHPDRSAKLILSNAWSRLTRTTGFEFGLEEASAAQAVDALIRNWGTGKILDQAAPTVARDTSTREWYARFNRLACSPGTAARMWRFLQEVDVRNVLSLVQAPTLVLHNEGDRLVSCEHGKYIAARIPNSRLILRPGPDHLHWAGDHEALAGEIQSFVTGERDAGPTDRSLLTVLFTDIVASTERLSEIGDRRWGDLLEMHNTVTRNAIARFGGREVDTTGDGFLVVFDRPTQALRCATEICRRVRERTGLEIRAGLHAGECELRGTEILGIAVHIAARVLSTSLSGQVTISRTVRDLVAGSNINLTDRGEYHLKGVEGTWQLFAVDAAA